MKEGQPRFIKTKRTVAAGAVAGGFLLGIPAAASAETPQPTPSKTACTMNEIITHEKYNQPYKTCYINTASAKEDKDTDDLLPFLFLGFSLGVGGLATGKIVRSKKQFENEYLYKKTQKLSPQPESSDDIHAVVENLKKQSLTEKEEKGFMRKKKIDIRLFLISSQRLIPAL